MTLCWLEQNQVKMFLLYSYWSVSLQIFQRALDTGLSTGQNKWLSCSSERGLWYTGALLTSPARNSDAISLPWASRHGSGVNKGRWFGEGRRLAIGPDSQCRSGEKNIFPKFMWSRKRCTVLWFPFFWASKVRLGIYSAWEMLKAPKMGSWKIVSTFLTYQTEDLGMQVCHLL